MFAAVSKYKGSFWSVITRDTANAGIPIIVLSIAADIGKYILEHSLPYDTLLNVNVPNLTLNRLKGLKLARQGKRIYDGAVKETFDPHGEKHYWIGGGQPYWEHGEDTDIQAVQDNYVSVTPIHLDLTNYDALTFLRERLPMSGIKGE